MQKLSVFISFFLIFFISNIFYAQLGEQAGSLYFNVSLGGSQTINYTVLNGGSTHISFDWRI
jgi:heme-binding NEAT domain protein